MAQSKLKMYRYRTFTNPGQVRPLGRRYVLRVFRVGLRPKNKEE